MLSACLKIWQTLLRFFFFLQIITYDILRIHYHYIIIIIVIHI